MNDNEKNENMIDVLTEFVKTLADSNSAILIEMKQQVSSSNAKIDKLIESVTILNNNHIETKKDREYDLLAMDQMKKDVKFMAHELNLMSKTVLLLDERVNNHNNKWLHVGTFFLTVLTVITASYFLKP